MITHGADPAQLTQLGITLRNQAQPINAVISTVHGVLSGTEWNGPARQQFEEEWNGTFRAVLDRLNAAFESAGTNCVSRAEQLSVLMGRG